MLNTDLFWPNLDFLIDRKENVKMRFNWYWIWISLCFSMSRLYQFEK